MRRLGILGIGALVLVVAACGGQEKTETPDVTPEPDVTADAVPIKEVSVSHVLIQFIGAASPAEGVTRRRAQAQELAEEVARRARAGEFFPDLAREYSDGLEADTGGYIGKIMTYQMPAAFSLALLELEIGETSDPVLTEYGYHVIRREAEQTASARHVLIAYAGALRAPEHVTRSPQEAQELAEQVLAMAREGTDFGRLAREYSDGPTAVNDGDLGEFPRGMMAPTFDAATFEAEPGDVVGVVETPFGFHVIQRYD